MTDGPDPAATLTAPRPHLALVETAAALPGLFPAAGWEALTGAGAVVARDPDTHPAVPALRAAGFTVVAIEPEEAPPPLTGRDLLAAPPTPTAARARGLLALTREVGDVTCLLDPDDPTFARDVGLAVARDADVEVEFVFLVGAPRGLALLDLVAVFDRLLDPDDGCPWDLEQDHASLAPHLVEETYEVLDAIASGDEDAIAEELGDVLMQVVFHAGIARERGGFDIDRVAGGIADKLRRRHPHVFGDAEVADADEVRASWESIKDDEKPDRRSTFDGVVRAMPALPLAAKVLARARRAGWAPGPEQALGLLGRATSRLDDLLGRARPPVERHDAVDAVDAEDAVVATDRLDGEVADAIGGLGLALVALALATGHDPEGVVRSHVDAFMGRFEAAERRAAARGDVPASTSAWQQALDDAAAAGW